MIKEILIAQIGSIMRQFSIFIVKNHWNKSNLIMIVNNWSNQAYKRVKIVANSFQKIKHTKTIFILNCCYQVIILFEYFCTTININNKILLC